MLRMERTICLNSVGEYAWKCEGENDGDGVRLNQLIGASLACTLY